MDDTITEKASKNSSYKKVKHQDSLYGELVRGKENIERLNDDWDKLFARAKDSPVYLSRAWIQTFINENHFKGEPCLIVVWNGSELAALLPFTIQNCCGMRIGKLISTEQPSYLGILLDSSYPEAVAVAAETWIRERVAHVFSDKHVLSRDEATQGFITELNRRGFNYKYGYERISHAIELGCSFDQYMQKNKTGKRRRKLGNAERQLFNSGNVEITRYVGKDITSEILRRIAQIQEESWMKQRGAAVLGQPFHKNMLTNLARAGFGSVWLMTIDGDDAAFAFTSIVHDTIHYQYPAFKLKYQSSLSIGQILLMQIIRDSCKENLRCFDFGQGDAEYKRFWANQAHSVSWVIAGRGFVGNIVIFCYRIAWRLAGQKFLLSLYKRIRK